MTTKNPSFERKHLATAKIVANEQTGLQRVIKYFPNWSQDVTTVELFWKIMT
jgi:hypothetical protein